MMIWKRYGKSMEFTIYRLIRRLRQDFRHIARSVLVLLFRIGRGVHGGSLPGLKGKHGDRKRQSTEYRQRFTFAAYTRFGIVECSGIWLSLLGRLG